MNVSPQRPRALIVEDEEKLRRVVALQLDSAGFEVLDVARAEDALPLISQASIILTDLRLPGLDGLGLLSLVQQRNPAVPVIVMTAYGTVELAVDAMKRGAADFLPKPFSLEHLMAVVNKALEVRTLREENVRLKEELGHRYRFDEIVGSTPAMHTVLEAAARVAATRSTILLCGESGTGKDLLARAIHHASPRAGKPFVKINCTAIPEHLLESELFGYEKGAFTGAATSKPGRFEQADGGTLFLDEIGDMPPQLQVKLLRVLQDREFERLGANKTRQIDVRIIAATNADLRRALEDGSFREDLYYRLNVFPITLPPLRERREDVPVLAQRFLSRFAAEQGAAVESLSGEAAAKLSAYDWPGNVRELENVIERSLLYADGHELRAEDIRLDHAPRKLAGNGGAGNGNAAGNFLPDGVSLDQHEQDLIREALKRAAGNKSHAARLLGLTRNALRYRLSQMGLE